MTEEKDKPDDSRFSQEKLEAGSGKTVPKRYMALAGRPMVVLSGLNDVSRDALLGRNLIIEHFPFTIGRFSREEPFSCVSSDLVLLDPAQKNISTQHLSIESHEDRIVLIDVGSRTGSLVNEERLGENAGGRRILPLKPGNNKVVLGGPSSPFVFEIQLLRKDMTNLHAFYTAFGERTVPVPALYVRLCHYAHDLLTSSDYSGDALIVKTTEVVRSISEDLNTIDKLYHYAAHPDSYSDVLVAHSVNTLIYCLKLFLPMEYSRDEALEKGTAALLHDIGAVDLPREILEKKGILSATEHEVLKKHSASSYERLASVDDEYRSIADMTLTHHERVDGSGYPFGVRHLDESVEIFNMVDFFEAVTHNRPQRGRFTPHTGIRMLLELERGKFSANALKHFVGTFSIFPIGSLVKLNSGQIGQVIRTHRTWPLRPVVRVLWKSDGQEQREEKEIDLSQDHILFITQDLSPSNAQKTRM